MTHTVGDYEYNLSDFLGHGSQAVVFRGNHTVSIYMYRVAQIMYPCTAISQQYPTVQQSLNNVPLYSNLSIMSPCTAISQKYTPVPQSLKIVDLLPSGIHLLESGLLHRDRLHMQQYNYMYSKFNIPVTHKFYSTMIYFYLSIMCWHSYKTLFSMVWPTCRSSLLQLSYKVTHMHYN